MRKVNAGITQVLEENHECGKVGRYLLTYLSDFSEATNYGLIITYSKKKTLVK